MGCGSSNNLDVLVFIGSLRKNSNNRGLVEALTNAPQFKQLGINIHTPNLQDIPFFNQDYQKDKKIPSSVTSLRKLCEKSQLLLFVTPQYNGGVSASIKNAYDWLSRPDPSFDNKPVVGGKSAGIISTSYLTQGQVNDCQKMGAYCKLKYFSKPYYVNLGSQVFDDKGRLTSEEQKKKLVNWGGQLVQFAHQNR